jgi:ornithine cyclodeaminase/alanine dehydrogenase
VIVVSCAQTEAGFDWADGMAAVRAAYAESYEGTPSARVIAASRGVSVRAMVAVPGGRFIGSKQIVRGTDELRYLIALFEKGDASLAYLLDGGYLTGVRTAVTSALAVAELSRGELSHVAILGSGTEARHHLEAVHQVGRPDVVTLFSPRAESRSAFVQWARSLGIEVIPFDEPQAAVEGADVVIAAARSTGERPILFGSWLSDARVVVSIGSTLPHQRELDVSVLSGARLIVSDEPEELLHHTGDLLAARDAGLFLEGEVRTLQELVSGTLAERLPTASTTPGYALFKSVGSALQDIAVAAAVVGRLEVADAAHVPFALRAR